MMKNLAARAWQTVKPHVPLIKFKKGGSSKGHAAAEPVSAPSQKEGVKQAAPKIQTVTRPTIEDWQLPTRYRRPMLDDKEIDMINSGGAY